VGPNLLARIATEGEPEDRVAAIRALTMSAAVRARRDLVRHVITNTDAGLASLALAPPAGERRTVYDAQHSQSDLPGVRERGEGDPASSDDAVNQAYDGSDTTYRFYHEVFNRDSLDGKGLEMVSSVHYGTDYDNALWNGSQMVYGDGSGRILAVGSLTRTIDVVGHELTHGVTQFTAGLEYHDQQGALNESMSDVFGSLVKQSSAGQTAE
jgi:Zn-dependent metalloprotease